MPLRIVRVTDSDLMESLYRFRHDIYVDELGWFADGGPFAVAQGRREQGRIGGGVFKDEFDDRAHNYAAYDDAGQVIGSVRVVPDGPLGLPLERCFPLNGYREGRRLAEICRLVIRRDCRGSRLGALLMKAAYHRCLAIGTTHIVLDTYVGNGEADALYEKMEFRLIGGPDRDPTYRCKLPV